MMLTRLPSSSRASQIGRGLVDPAADPGDDPLRHIHHVLIVAETDVGELELALPLDIDLGEAVHHDVGDRFVAQQRLERSQANHVVDDRRAEQFLLAAVERQPLLGYHLCDQLQDLAISSSRGSLVAAVASMRS